MFWCIMASKNNKDFSTTSWNFIGDELKLILQKIKQEVSEKREKALNEASIYLKQKFEEATWVKSGKLKASWILNDKYKNVRYIYNIDILPAGDGNPFGGVPKLNLVEYSKIHGKPFVRKTFDANVYSLEKIMEKVLKEE